jgi:hypothetical protein
LAEELPLNGEMKSFADLEAAARKLGLATRVVRWRRDQSPRVPRPCIVRLVPKSAQMGAHLAVLLAATPGAVQFFDPPKQAVWIADEELFREWDGLALYVATDARPLDAIAPASPMLICWISLGCVLMGAGMRSRVGRSPRAESEGRSIGRRPWPGPLAVSCLGWLAVVSGIIWMSGAGPSSSRQSLISVEQPALDIPISEAALRESNGRVQGTFVLTDSSGPNETDPPGIALFSAVSARSCLVCWAGVSKNRGDRPAVIAHVVPNCTCASVTVSSSRIPAHGSAWIKTEVTLNDDASREARVAVDLKDAIPQRLVLRVRVRRADGLLHSG